LLRMTDNMTTHNIDLSSRDTLYVCVYIYQFCLITSKTASHTDEVTHVFVASFLQRLFAVFFSPINI
jgi:hypothetical protein